MENILHLARYQFTFRMNQEVRLPEHSGSTLRGVFGHALRQLSCMTKARECNGCALLQQCPFPQVFAPHELPKSTVGFAKTLQEVPVAFVIEEPLATQRYYKENEMISFGMILIGPALQHLPLITLAWQRAFARGVSASQSTANLIRVEHIQAFNEPLLIYSKAQSKMVEHNTLLVIPNFSQLQDIHIKLLTPLRIEQKKQPLGPRQITASAFFRQLIRRVSLLAQTYPEYFANYFLPSIEKIRELNTLADNVQEERRLDWQEWQRYSGRQQQAIKMGGVVGHWFFKDVPTELLTYLYIGQWLHAGKETVYGLGRYEISQEIWQTN